MNPDISRSGPALLRHAGAGLLVIFLTLGGLCQTPAAETNSASNIALKPLAEGLKAPVALAAIPDASGRLLVADQAGVIYLLDRLGKRSEQPFLDLRTKLVGLSQGMEERGLLSIALHPQFKANHKFYLVYTAPLRPNAPPKWDNTERLSEFKTRGDDLSAADPDSERVVLEIDKPDWNHNSGRIAFGLDGFLYWTVGDGGAPNDVGDASRGREHPPGGNGQKLDSLLGKLLRIDIDATPYGIPKDNPYAENKKGYPEIFAYGLRNPWGMSFDRGGKHDLIVTDVGQDRWEEINIIVKGGNYGWRLREGFDGFDPQDTLHAPTNAPTVGADGKPFVDPVFVYKTLRGRGTDPESYGVTITGGYVYRGKAFPSLVGKYVFADWSRSMALPIWHSARRDDPFGRIERALDREPLALKEFPNGRLNSFIWALAEDEEGELYALCNGINSVALGRGKVFKLVPQ